LVRGFLAGDAIAGYPAKPLIQIDEDSRSNIIGPDQRKSDLIRQPGYFNVELEYQE
jgi:hypothetical protein